MGTGVRDVHTKKDCYDLAHQARPRVGSAAEREPSLVGEGVKRWLATPKIERTERARVIAYTLLRERESERAVTPPSLPRSLGGRSRSWSCLPCRCSRWRARSHRIRPARCRRPTAVSLSAPTPAGETAHSRPPPRRTCAISLPHFRRPLRCVHSGPPANRSHPAGASGLRTIGPSTATPSATTAARPTPNTPPRSSRSARIASSARVADA